MSFCTNLKFAICILQFAIIAIPLAVISTPANGDEGMWLFNSPPNKILKERYNFTAAPEWLKHVQLASLRINKRRVGVVRLGRRAGDDQSSRRGRRPAKIRLR